MVQEREEVDYGVRGRLKSIITHKEDTSKGNISIIYAFNWYLSISYDVAFELHHSK
jgi:hypothetical protein